MVNKFLIKHPLITEKAAALSKDGKYIFLLQKDASASEAKKAVESYYKVKVTKTNIINAKPKSKKSGRFPSVKPGYKKFIVTLQKGQKLDIIPQ